MANLVNAASSHTESILSELKVKYTKSGRTRKPRSKWVQYGKCARKVLQGHSSVGDASILSPPWASISGISLSFSYIYLKWSSRQVSRRSWYYIPQNPIVWHSVTFERCCLVADKLMINTNLLVFYHIFQDTCLDYICFQEVPSYVSVSTRLRSCTHT